MDDTLECPSCGALDSGEAQETSSGAEMVCSDCGYRFYPPEDRHDYQTRAALRRRPEGPGFTVNWDK